MQLLTQHSLQGVETLQWLKIIETLGKFLSSFRESEE